MGIPTMIHEQNSIIGLTNKILIKKVDKIVCCYQKAYNEFPHEKTVLLGNPRASVVSSRRLQDIHHLYQIPREKNSCHCYGESWVIISQYCDERSVKRHAT